jgi:cell division protein FtsZ
MKDSGYAHMGVGSATGREKAEQCANMAITSPLIETDMKGARGVIINITASDDIGLEEVEIASNIVAQKANEDANIIWGVSLDSSMTDEMRMTVIATNFGPKGSGDLIDMVSENADSDYVDVFDLLNNR